MYLASKMKFLLSCGILFLTLSMNAQQSLEGLWNTEKENTIVEILQENGNWVGQIKSSDNSDVVIGKTILKDLEKKGDSWEGQIYLVKRQKWASVQITPEADQLDLVVSVGFAKKNLTWPQVKG